MNILDRIQRCQAHLLALLPRYLPIDSPSSPLFGAMNYACLNGGKRLRPLLTYSTGELFGLPWETLDPIAAAIECIHCYSLVHDDLPSMDNDDFRRGKPTCHKVFGEAMAILAGDALLTLAFEILATPEHFLALSESKILKMAKIIASAAGTPQGMVQGQSLDILAKNISLQQLMTIHQAKTGALITASVQCGAIAAEASDSDLDELQKFGHAIGLAFQIQDDVLDALGNRDMMGKDPGQDAKNNKCTFVTLMGIDEARAHARAAQQQAMMHLERFGEKAEPLRALSHYIIERVA